MPLLKEKSYVPSTQSEATRIITEAKAQVFESSRGTSYKSINFLYMEKGLPLPHLAYTNNHPPSHKEMVKMDGIIDYFKKVSSDNPHVWMHEDYLGGMPCIKNKRIPVSQIIAHLTSGVSLDKTCRDFSVTPEEIQSAVYFALDILNGPFVQDFSDEDILG